MSPDMSLTLYNALPNFEAKPQTEPQSTLTIQSVSRANTRLTARPVAPALICLLLTGSILSAQTTERVEIPGTSPKASPRAISTSIPTNDPPRFVIPRSNPPATLNTNQRELHALSRLTFGPTSADQSDIHRLGIDGWLELQLHPDRLPVTPADHELSTHLSQFPAMQLPVERLLEQFPSRAETRQAANGKLALPSDPTIAAIYRRDIALYDQKLQEKQGQPIPASAPGTPAQPRAAQPPPAPAPGSEAIKDKPNTAENQPSPMAPEIVRSILALPPISVSTASSRSLSPITRASDPASKASKSSISFRA